VVSAQAAALLPGWPITGVASLLRIASDGTLQMPLKSGRAAVLNRDGTRKRVVANVPASPDGRVYRWPYAGGSVSAYTPEGRLLWTSPPLFLGPEASYPYLRADAEGDVYAVGEWGMVALDPSGRIRWREQWGSDNPGVFTIGPEGTLYLGYLSRGAGTLVARRPDGETLWERPLGGRAVRMEVADDGTLIVAQTYAGGTALRAVAPDGTERWMLRTEHLPLWMAIGADGTLYFTTPADVRGSAVVDPGLVWVVGPEGSPRWTYRGARIAMADPIVGGDGTIYVGACPLVALHPDGTRAWSFPPTAWPLVPRVIGGDGTLYAEGGGAWFAIPGPSARARVTPPSPEGQRRLIAVLRLTPTRFRMRGPAQLCPSPRRGCRPTTPLGATLRFTLKRDAAVLVVIRRAGRKAVVTRRSWRAKRGTTWSGLWEAADYHTLAPGRYTLTVRAALGLTRVSTGPIRLSVAR